MTAMLNTLIQIVLYTLACVGVFLLFGHVWRDVYAWMRHTYYGIGHRQMLRVSEGFRSSKKATTNDRVQEHLELLLRATLKKSSKPSVSRFVMGSVVGSAVVFLLALAGVHNLPLAAVTALLALVVPYGLLNIRRYHLGIQNSYDIGILIDILVPEYRKHHGSMLHALTAAVEYLPTGPLRRSVARLVDQLANHVTPVEARRAVDKFSKELGTSWAVQIANDIEHAIVDGVDVEFSLSLTHKEFKEIEDARKGQKFARLDSLLVACVPFVMWPGMMVLFYFYLSRNIFLYQFDTPASFRWFIITLIFTFGSFMVGIIFYRPKQDI